MRQRQAAVSNPYRASISGGDRKLMLLRARKPYFVKRGAPQPVEAGICGHPRDPLPVDQHLPDAIGAESLVGRETFPRGRFERKSPGPLVYMIKSLDALAGHYPHRTIRGEGEVAELRA